MNRKSEIHTAYERVGALAARYDGMMTSRTLLGRIALHLFWQFSTEEYTAYLSQLFAGIPADFAGDMLEVPVGTGALSLPVYEGIPRARITCLDYAEGMLGAARALAKERGIENVSFRQGDVGALPFDDGSFDLVLSVNGLHAFPNKDAALAETHRVLKHGGTFCGGCYVRGERAVTDLFTRTFCTWRGYFTPPFDSAESLRARLAERYERVELETIGAFACFVCQKK